MATHYYEIGGFGYIGSLLFIIMSYVADVPVWLKIIFGVIGSIAAIYNIIYTYQKNQREKIEFEERRRHNKKH